MVLIIQPMNNMNHCFICYDLKQDVIEAQLSVENYKHQTIDIARRLIQFIESNSTNMDFDELTDIQLELSVMRDMYQFYFNQVRQLTQNLQLHQILTHHF